MRDFLTFQLWGPLASWGGIAVGEERGSEAHPTRSAVLGILAAGLGIPRGDEPRQTALSEAYALAVRCDRPGAVLRDFHTAQVPPRSALRRRRAATRRDELAALAWHIRQKNSAEGTVVSYREYRSDGGWRVAVAARETAPYPLEALREALLRPGFSLYLGRRSCPTGLPLAPRIVRATTVLEVFDQLPVLDPAALLAQTAHGVGAVTSMPVFADADLAPEGAVLATRERRDQPVSRRRWQFSPRLELECRATRSDP